MSYYSDFQRQRQERGHYVSGGEPVEAVRKVGRVAGDSVAAIWHAVVRIHAAWSRYRDRRSAMAELRSLPAETLRDIGISRGEICRVVRDIEQGHDPRRQE